MATVTTVQRFNLASGDRLTRAEFERRYAALPENLKCQLNQPGPCRPDRALAKFLLNSS